jgi:hypothetical protein
MALDGSNRVSLASETFDQVQAEGDLGESCRTETKDMPEDTDVHEVVQFLVGICHSEFHQKRPMPLRPTTNDFSFAIELERSAS